MIDLFIPIGLILLSIYGGIKLAKFTIFHIEKDLIKDEQTRRSNFRRIRKLLK